MRQQVQRLKCHPRLLEHRGAAFCIQDLEKCLSGPAIQENQVRVESKLKAERRFSSVQANY